MKHDNEIIHFKETQRFTQWWLWLIIISAATLCLYGAFQQIVLGKPFGNNPGPDWLLIVVAVIVGVLIPLAFLKLSLRVFVRDDGIRIIFFPLHLKGLVIPYDRIARFYVRKYRAIREYGGWGIRFGPGGKAYNVKGSLGLQLELSDGEKILIGSQQPERLASAIVAASGRQAEGSKLI